MKFTSLNITSVLSSMKDSKIKAALIYGPDKGLIDYIYGQIVKTLNKSSQHIAYKDLISGGIDIALNNTTLFGNQDIVKITEVGTSIDNNLKNILISGTYHIPIFIADELPPSSSIRKLFESESSLASIACYNDDEASIKRISSAKIAGANKTISQDALIYLSNHLIGDRYIIENELEKLLLFTHDKSSISLADVEQSISKSIVSSPDSLCISFAQGNGKKYFEEANKLLAENISIVWIIRALTRYYINLYIVILQLENGLNLDSAIASLKPPIFFKYLPDFKAICTKHNKKKILHVLNVLSNAEKISKSSISSADNLCDNLFFSAHYEKI